jgi:hypothetical protein
LGKELASVRTGEDEPAPERVREAIRDVIGHCIYGVDKNPLSVDLCRLALWLESHTGERPLSFLDHRIQCGDSLLGVFDLEVIKEGVPDEAFKALIGDDRETARALVRRNRDERAGQRNLLAWAPNLELQTLARASQAIDHIRDDTPAAVRRKRLLYEASHSDREWERQKEACDLWTAAFFQRLRPGEPVITTDAVLDRLQDREVPPQLAALALDLADRGRFFHWPLEFPETFADGGFDVVLGNPPWERIKLQEQEFFAARDPRIAAAPNAAVRGTMITTLGEAESGTLERALHEDFETAKRMADAASVFAREGGRFPLTGRGDVNTYALFAELFTALASPRGRSGVIVPTGIATDATTSSFFAALIDGQRLVSLVDFENRLAIFPAVHRSYKFSLLTMGRGIAAAQFTFFLTNVLQVSDVERSFTLSPADIASINPNTRTASVFRSRADAELTAKIYARVPVMIDEAKVDSGNPWGARFHTRIWHMAEDAEWFRYSLPAA